MQRRLWVAVAFLVVAVLVLGTPAQALASSLTPVVDAGDWLITKQDASGGFPWTGTTVATNITGATARGLLQAYQRTGDSSYLNAAIAAGNYLVPTYPRTYTDGDPRFATYDVLFLEELSLVTNDLAYANFVQTYFWDKLVAGVYGESNDQDAAAFAQAVIDSRTSQGYAALASWDLAGIPVAAQLASETAVRDAVMAKIKVNLEGLSASDTTFAVIGLAGAVWASAVSGYDLDPAAGIYAAAGSTGDLAALLASKQVVGATSSAGGWPSSEVSTTQWVNDGSVWKVGFGDQFETTLTKQFTNVTTDVLSFKMRMNIEQDWDYGQLLISPDGTTFTPVEVSPYTTTSNPNNQNPGNGFTGTVSGDAQATASTNIPLFVSGSTYWVQFRFIADAGASGNGGSSLTFNWELDDITVNGVTDDASSTNGWTVGFTSNVEAESQATAFALMALEEFDPSAYLSNIVKGIGFLYSMQDTSGQFLSEPGGSPDYDGATEVTGECLAALVTTAPSDVFVDDDWVGSSYGDEVESGKYFGYNAFGSIQDGIDAVFGSTVNVAAGTYAESIAVEVDGLTLLGPNTGIDPNGATARNAEAVIQPPTASYGIYVEAQDVTIDGFTIDGQATALYGIYAATTTGQGELLLTNNIVKNIVNYGFIGYVPSGAPSSDNLVSQNLFDSIQGRSIVALWNYYADVVNNVVQDTAIGIYAENANQAESTGTVEWKQNKISATRAGIWYNLAYGTATPLTISDNIIDVEDNPLGTRWDGIWLTSLGGSVNPTISGNVITGAPVTQLTIGYHMWNNTTTATDGIVVQGGSVSDVDYGVWINNWDGYPTVGGSNAGRSTAKLNQMTIDGAAIAGVYLKDNPSNTSGASAYVYANVQDSTITNSGIGILVDGEDASVKANSNGIFGNTQGMVNNNAATTMDAENNWWGTACSPASLISGNVDYTPWWGDATGSFSLSATATTINPGDSAAQQMAVINCAAPGTTVTYPTPPGSFPGGIIVTANDVTIDLSGSTIGFGSPAYTIVGDDVTLTNGILDGSSEPSPASPGVLVQAGADNFILDNVEVKNWADGVQLAGSVTSFKLVNNWIHSNTDAGLQVDAGVTIGGLTTIDGNLFKVNGGNGVQNNGDMINLDVEYNSWGDVGGPTVGVGDGVGGSVDYDPWTFAEVYMDVDPGTSGDQYQINVDESTSFNVDLMVEGKNLFGVAFEFTYDTDYLSFNGPPTFVGLWNGKCADDGSSAGTIRYVCNLTSAPAFDSGPVGKFNFTADLSGVPSVDPGPWTTYFDITPDEADTSAGAIGGVKVFVNNAGFNDPSVTARDITNTDPPVDGQINITGIAQFTGFVDLQGRPNDSGALVEAKDGATVKANATSASSGKYTTSYVSTFLLAIGASYDVTVDRALYLPATRTWTLNDRPLTTLTTVILLGGDADNNDVIGIDDATCIGGAYGWPPANCGTGGSSDVNGDGTTNILDLVLFGGNYGLTASPWTP